MLLRSAEVKPLFYRFVQLEVGLFSSLLFLYQVRTLGQVQLDFGMLWWGLEKETSGRSGKRLD